MGLKTMSGFQFAHVDGYGRKGGKNGKTKERVLSMSEIAAEAERHPDAIPHIEKPLPPILLFGVMPSEVVKEAEEGPKLQRTRLGGNCGSTACAWMQVLCPFRQIEWMSGQPIEMKQSSGLKRSTATT